MAAAGAALLARRAGAAPARVVPRMRAARGRARCSLALAGTALAVTQVERRGGRDDPEATPGRLASVQSNRYAYWKVALRTFGDHPLAGVGSGGFQAEWLRERPFREPVRDAHSLYLETARGARARRARAAAARCVGAVAVARPPRRAARSRARSRRSPPSRCTRASTGTGSCRR